MKNLLAVFLFAFPLFPAAAVTFEELSFEEKLGQTLVAFVDVDSAEQLRPAIETGKIGGVLIQWGNYSLAQTEELIAKLQRWAANSPHKIPLFISIDYEGGTVYTPITLGFDYLPTNMMLSAAADEEGAAAIAYLAGLELRRAGVHINFSPVLDVNNNPDNPIIGVRSFGADPADVTKMGIALINGFKAAGVMSIVKHFPGHGDTAQDSHYAVPVVKASAEQMQKVHLAPFAAAVKQGVSGVMTGHVLYPALDAKNIATFSKPILQDLLKTRMGFKGLIVTDSLDMKSATTYCTIAGCAVRSLENGADMILLGRYIKPLTVFAQTSQEIKTKNLQPRVEEAARKIFEAKRNMGLLNPPAHMPQPSHEAYRAELEKISAQAVTLVRNRKKTIPFIPAPGNKKPTVCAVFFAPARFSDQLMNFSKPFLEKGWNVRSYNAALTPRKKDSQRAAACAKGADLLILTSLQWADKTNINQKNAINGLIKENKNTVFISTMSPYDIKNYPEADTVLATYGLNRYVLQTAADIILGNQQAQGKLPVELPAK
ncbi:MAG: glycoside hydrolase family 3 N-terminal domain-containing protein [Elusimicrobia bacterium]|nr:glycoside hydrolase family 3 N-terminal domain-containing protein [Elusimicrobiota bacterium]MDY6039426.1 glycoside hydrolase family 3 N-terminal domain-containing protein [Elusimicrobiaceae bacterium]